MLTHTKRILAFLKTALGHFSQGKLHRLLWCKCHATKFGLDRINNFLYFDGILCEPKSHQYCDVGLYPDKCNVQAYMYVPTPLLLH